MKSVGLLLVGASVRAAAFSALRAQLRPYCADLFADGDLAAICLTVRVAASEYPAAYRDIVRSAPPGPWMYTGALENHRGLVRQLADGRELWGNGAAALRKARDPKFIFELLQANGSCCPRVWVDSTQLPATGNWLLKPRCGAAGASVRPWDGKRSLSPRRCFLQEYIPGDPHAAVYVGDGRAALLLGVTRQLVGETWLHARPFGYCGSMGPLFLQGRLRLGLERLGCTLAAGCGLRGLFGVDFILADGVPWPVEINPRYTASVEVHEYATGIQALALHRSVFENGVIPDVKCDRPNAVVGKAILYAMEDLAFPAKGPWLSVLEQPGPIDEIRDFADIPHGGERIPRGRPILTLLARAPTLAACRNALQRRAGELDRLFFERRMS